MAMIPWFQPSLDGEEVLPEAAKAAADLTEHRARPERAPRSSIITVPENW